MADRISNLPDELLCHILSFLPTEESAATILLSKRWRPLWPLVSTLDFDDKKKKSDSSFIKFVYAALVSRNLHQPIINFRLICESHDSCPDSDVKVWLNAAIQRGVENLKVHLTFSDVPCSVLSCTSLVVLDLRFVNFDAVSSFYLPSLKTLHLDGVGFVKPQSFMELLYGCPILQDLHAHEVAFDEYSFEGKVESLSKLVRADVSFEDCLLIPLKVFCNVQFLCIDQWDVDIPVFPNLIHLELYVIWGVVIDILNHCPKLQTLVLNLNRVDDREFCPYRGFVPKCFSSHLRKCFLINYSGLECEMRFARYVMQNSTSLRTMEVCNWDQNHEKKLEMIKGLASYPRSSSICELIFN